MTNRKVLLVEDEKHILNHFAANIEKEGYEVLMAGNGEEAWKIFQGSTILVVVTDLMMPIKGGLDILRDIKKHSPTTRVIIITGLGGKDHAIQALKLDAFDYIEKGPRTAASALLEAIKRAFVDVDAQNRAEKEMLSFLTHTLFSTISGGPETVEQVLEDAQSALGDRYRESDVYNMISNIASLKAIFMSMANMLRAYRMFANEPDAFKQKWDEDEEGGVPLEYLFSAVLTQTLGSILFEETNLKRLNGILAAQKGYSIETVRETFLNDVFWSKKLSNDSGQVLGWVERYLPVLSLAIKGPAPSFNASGLRYSFLFSIFSEVVYNALKYTDCRESIQIEWEKTGDLFVFSCRNTFNEVSTKRKGSQKGLAFVSSLTQMIKGIDLSRNSEQGTFTIEIRLEDSLLNGKEVL